MPQDLRDKLQRVIDREVALLRKVTEADLPAAPALGSAWSRKEELGHLIDSATNNHMRFVRASLEAPFRGPGYDQNGWVRLHAYDTLPWDILIDFWYRYNLLLAHVAGQIPEARLETECYVGDGAKVTLRFLIEDYIRHMQHHLDHILLRPAVTPYPEVATAV